MPEGPELKRSRDALQPLVSKVVASCHFFGGRYASKGPEGLRDFINMFPLRLESLEVKGKFMHWQFRNETASAWMHVTYGMTGQWSPKKSKHSAGCLTFVDGSSIFYNDTRRFGTIKFVFSEEEHQRKLASLGPDMLSENVNDEKFIERMRKRPNKTIVEVLLDQSIISGVGNYVKAEALYAARLSPHRVVAKITDDELKTLRYNIVDIMTNSYRSGGATIRDYADPEGNEGLYGSLLKVYGRSLDPHGNEVIKEETLDGRTTWWCPEEQK